MSASIGQPRIRIVDAQPHGRKTRAPAAESTDRPHPTLLHTPKISRSPVLTANPRPARRPGIGGFPGGICHLGRLVARPDNSMRVNRSKYRRQPDICHGSGPCLQLCPIGSQWTPPNSYRTTAGFGGLATVPHSPTSDPSGAQSFHGEQFRRSDRSTSCVPTDVKNFQPRNQDAALTVTV
jgi:hypothetical protein